VLPVPDVAAAADWFCRVLGFHVDFLYGDPPVHGRVKLGDHSWGAPVYIHLSKSDGAIQPCGELRLHAGHDIDGLHAHVLAAGGQVTMPPTDQPWGLREIEITGPAGHRLRIGAETAHAAAAATPRTVIVNYRAKPGHEDALLDLVRQHVPTLQRLGLATERAPFIMRAADGTLVEVFEWASAEAIARAHHEPGVLAMWERFGAACEFGPLNRLPETAQMFAEFDAV